MRIRIWSCSQKIYGISRTKTKLKSITVYHLYLSRQLTERIRVLANTLDLSFEKLDSISVLLPSFWKQTHELIMQIENPYFKRTGNITASYWNWKQNQPLPDVN